MLAETKKDKKKRDHHHHHHHSPSISSIHIFHQSATSQEVIEAPKQSMPDRKRSLSPNTETSFNNQNYNQNSSESSNKLSNGSLKFKPSTTATANESYKSNQSTTYSPRGRKQDQIDNDIDLDGPLLTNFESSDKRKRLSIQGHPPASGIQQTPLHK